MSAVLESALDEQRRADCARNDQALTRADLQQRIRDVHARQLEVMYTCRTPDLETMQWRRSEVLACERELQRLRALRDGVAQ